MSATEHDEVLPGDPDSPVEGDVVEEQIPHGSLQVGIKTSIITGTPVGILVKLNEGETVLDVERAEALAIQLFRFCSYLVLQQQAAMQAQAERAMQQKGSGLMGPDGRPIS